MSFWLGVLLGAGAATVLWIVLVALYVRIALGNL